MTAPTDLRTHLAEALAFDWDTFEPGGDRPTDSCMDYMTKFENYEEGYRRGGQAHSSALAPLHSALADCVLTMTEAAEYASQDDCNGFAGELCKEALARLGELLGGEK